MLARVERGAIPSVNEAVLTLNYLTISGRNWSDYGEEIGLAVALKSWFNVSAVMRRRADSQRSGVAGAGDVDHFGHHPGRHHPG